MKLLSWIFILFAVLPAGHAQSGRLDSLEQVWAEITDDSLRLAEQIAYGWDLYDAYNYEAANEFSQRLMASFPSALTESGLYRNANFQQTALALAIGEIEAFRETWAVTYQHCADGRDTNCLINLLNLQAGQFSSALRYDSAYQTYQAALELATATNDVEIAYTIRNNVAIIFGEQGLLDKAKASFWEATLGALAQKDSILVFLGYNNVGRCFIEMEQPDSAAYYLEAAQSFSTAANELADRATYYYNYGLLEVLRQNPSAALQGFHQSLYWAQQSSDVFTTCQVYAEIGQLHLELNQVDSALHYLQLAEQLGEQLEVNEVLRDVLPLMARSYAEQEAWQDAYQYANKSLVLRDEYLKEQVQQQVAEMEAKYQLSNYVQENELLRTIGEEREAKLRERTVFAILGLIGLLIISGLVVGISRQNRTIKTLNHDLEKKVEERTAELEGANVRLQEYLDDLRVFTHVTSHDLKEPLRNISGFSSLLHRRLGSAVEQDAADFMEMIRANANQMHELIEGIQFYATLDPNEQTKEVEQVDLMLMCKRVEEGLKTFLEERKGRIEMPEPLPTIMASPQVLQVALKNLIENGLKYNDSNTPLITITYLPDQEWHLIQVADNGIGIEAEYQDQIFEMFKRLHTRQDYNGTGMGLGISRRLIRRSGGDIEVNSKPGEGSTFTIRFPKNAGAQQ